MIVYAENYEVFKDLHLTFHIGNDQVWKNSDSNEYYYHNVNEVMKILKKLSKRKDVRNKNQVLDFYKFNINQIRNDEQGYHEKHYLRYGPDINETSI